MAYPTFNGFSLQDDNFITERVMFKGYADRAVIRANVGRREGVKLLNTEFGEKEVVVEGNVIAASAGALQTLLDNMKKALTAEEADLIIENGRTFTATVKNTVIPDEHYNQSKAPFEVTFICTNPFAVGPLQTSVTPVPSGLVTFSGSITISGTLFGRPTITYTPGSPVAGNTRITKLVLTHTQSGQSITVSGFGSGTQLSYANAITINFDNFSTLEGSTAIDNSGAFPKWDPGTNTYTLTATGAAFPGGSVSVAYQPRYL